MQYIAKGFVYLHKRKGINLNSKISIMETKNLKISKKTLTITFETSEKIVCNLDRYKAVSIAILNGFCNPLRKYSTGDTAINVDKLISLRRKYDELIYDVIGELDVDVESIEYIN